MTFILMGFICIWVLFGAMMVLAYVAHKLGPRGNAGLVLLIERDRIEADCN